MEQDKDDDYNSMSNFPLDNQDDFALFKHDRYVKDSIHSQISFKQFYWNIIDTAEYQRLREIKQLGPVYYVFPGAVHTRFEHGLGVGFMAQTMMEHFEQIQQSQVQITESDKQNVIVAGLCNDLGQGIFSHFFDRQLIPHLAELKSMNSFLWDYKDASIMMFKHLIDENNIDIDPFDIKQICELIKADYKPKISTFQPKKAWMFDIVSNKKNPIDADKFDYIQRDIYNLGLLRNLYDPGRLITSCKVIQNDNINNVCYHLKNNEYLKNLFQQRYNMFKQVYTHKVCQAISFMFVDALALLDDKFKFLENLNNPQEYFKFTDSIIKHIECKKNPEFKKSQEILTRIKKRDLYTFVGERIYHPYSKLIPQKVKAIDIVNCQDDNKLTIDDIIVHQFNINYGFGVQNPVDQVPFYHNNEQKSSESYQKNKVSLMPNQFSENYIRLFVKDSSKKESAERAFDKYIKRFC